MDARNDICALLAAARGGQPDALGRVFEVARGHLLQLAERELPAELRAKVGPSDLVQETAIEMQRDFARFTGTTAEECFAWLREMLRTNAIARRGGAQPTASPAPSLNRPAESAIRCWMPRRTSRQAARSGPSTRSSAAT